MKQTNMSELFKLLKTRGAIQFIWCLVAFGFITSRRGQVEADRLPLFEPRFSDDLFWVVVAFWGMLVFGIYRVVQCLRGQYVHLDTSPLKGEADSENDEETEENEY